MFPIEDVFVKMSLVPVLVRNAQTGDVLMLGYASLEALKLTLETRKAWFFSRTRGKLWQKGETSGNYLSVVRVATDCDADALLYDCIPNGPTCHTGAESCFFNEIWRCTDNE